MTDQQQAIHVVLAADGTYAMPLAVTIASAVANCSRKQDLIFYILCNDFSEALRRRVEVSAQQRGGSRIEWIEAGTEKLQGLPIIHKYMTSMIYSRLLAPALLPLTIRKALYLDSDTVVLGDIAEIWQTDFQRRSLLAVRDRIGTVGAPKGLLNHRELGIPASAHYFNSGVLMMDLSRWRERNIAERVISYLITNRHLVQMGDQDGLNAVLFDDWAELDFRWNWQVVPDRAAARREGCWGLDLNEKSIVHFVTSVKPWLPACGYDERHLFFRYLDQTAWAGWRVPLRRRVTAHLKSRIREALSAGRAQTRGLVTWPKGVGESP